MIIHRLETRSFRNLVDQVLAPHGRFNVFFGDNAQGKTNLLEAIYLVASLKSLRGNRTAELITLGQEKAAVTARVQTADLTRELEVQITATGRRALLDGKAVRSATSWNAGGGLNVVLFSPDDLQIPRGSPAGRRRLLDRAIANIWSGYLAVARDYQRTLQSRNKLLKEQRINEHQLEVYNQQLAQLGAKVVAGRLRYLAQISERFSAVFAEIVQTDVVGTLRYEAPADVLEASDDTRQLHDVLLRQLRQGVASDRARRVTCHGPHVHELDFRLGEHSTCSFGSQGQLRALLLAFKITQIIDSHRRRGDYPVLLLDDVSSELDAHRNDYLFRFLAEISCQTFITTTRAELIPIRENSLNFQIVNGNITGPISLV